MHMRLILSHQTVKSDFTDVLPLLQSPPAPPPELRRSQLLVGSARYLQRVHETCWNAFGLPAPLPVVSCQKLTISCPVHQ